MVSLTGKIPLMREGRSRRNTIIGLVYLFTFPLWLSFIPFIIPILVWRDYAGLATSLSRVPGIKEGGGITSGILSFVFLIVLISVLGAALPEPNNTGTESQMADTPTSPAPTTTEIDPATDSGTTSAADNQITDTQTTTAPTTTTESKSDPTSTTMPTTSITTTTTTTTAPAPDGESYSYSGSGNDVTNSFGVEGGLVVFDFEHSGNSNFQVQAVSSSGEKKYLVNDIGTYDGQVALYLPEGEWQLDITADGDWNADITQPRFNSNDIESLPKSADGEQAAWFGPFNFSGTTEITFTIKDDSQAAVWLATHEGRRVELLHNEVGPYEGSALTTQEGVGLIIIDTDSADWKIEIKE